MALFDITVPVHPGMFVYPGNPQVFREPVLRMEAGDPCNLSRIDLGVHTGTHIDAPVHFIEDGNGIDGIPTEALLGEALVVDATSVESEIDAAFLATVEVPAGTERVLFKTRNSSFWDRGEFTDGYVGVAPDAAALLVERGVKLVGIDYLSVATPEHGIDTHRVLLGAGTVILEGIDLSAVEPGWYELVCLPIRLVGSDGAPARAILRSLAGTP